MTSPNLRSEVAARAAELEHARVPFVHARVVLAERPTSAKPGDEALVLADGTMEGFVGGTCAESTVRAQAMALLDSQESLLLRITPTPEPSSPGKLTVHNPCLSGGTLEIFLEPVVPAPRLVVVGHVADRPRHHPAQRGRSATSPRRGTARCRRMRRRSSSPRTVVDEEEALVAALRAEHAVRRSRRQPQARRGRARRVGSVRVADGAGAQPCRHRHRCPHARGGGAVDPRRGRGQPTTTVGTLHRRRRRRRRSAPPSTPCAA